MEGQSAGAPALPLLSEWPVLRRGGHIFPDQVTRLTWSLCCDACEEMRVWGRVVSLPFRGKGHRHSSIHLGLGFCLFLDSAVVTATLWGVFSFIHELK